MSRRAIGLVVLAAVVVSSLITWYATLTIQSPAEVAARTAPPEPSLIVVPVEEKVLATKIVSRGTGRYGSPRALAVTPSALKESRQIVTSLPRVGATVAEGDVLLTLSGRPVFVLTGGQPAYRDLGPGMVGRDVKQLEQALRRIGLSPGRVDGAYDSGTERAVQALYRRHGHSPLVATEAALAAARPAEAALIAGAQARAGVQLPSDEVVFVRATPLRVTELQASVGAEPDGPIVTVTTSTVSVAGALPVEQAGLLKPGARVVIDEPALAIRATGRVGHVAAQPGTNGLDGFHVFFEVVVDDPPPALVGASVRLTIPIESTREAALAVPVSALSLAPDGGSRVQRSVDGKLDFVVVEPGLSADGYVAVKPLRGRLAAGDMVVVGFEGNGTTSG